MVLIIKIGLTCAVMFFLVAYNHAACKKAEDEKNTP